MASIRAFPPIFWYTAPMVSFRIARPLAILVCVGFLLSEGGAETVAPVYPEILDFPAPTTTQGEDRVFVTTGYLLLSGDRARAESLIADIPRWREWMLSGMDGPRDDGKRLLVYLLDLAWKPAADGAQSSDILEVSAILPFMKAFGADPSIYSFSVEVARFDDGSLSRVVARFVGDSVALREAEYVIAIEDAPEGETTVETGSFVVRYEARVKINAFFDFFFSLKAYRRTIGWYLDRIARNFIDAWKGTV